MTEVKKAQYDKDGARATVDDVLLRWRLLPVVALIRRRLDAPDYLTVGRGRDVLVTSPASG